MTHTRTEPTKRKPTTPKARLAARTRPTSEENARLRANADVRRDPHPPGPDPHDIDAIRMNACIL
jgi:hypothetical protein